MTMFVDEFKWAIDVFLNPEKRTDKAWKAENALRLYYKVSVIPLVIFILGELFVGVTSTSYAAIALGKFSATLGAIGLTGGLILLTLVSFWVVVPVSLWISAYFVNWAGHKIKSFKKNDFNTTFSALMYGALAWLVFSWVPFLSWFTGLWSVLVTLIALKNLQKVSSFFGAFLTWMIGEAVLVAIYGVILLVISLAFPTLIFPHP